MVRVGVEVRIGRRSIAKRLLLATRPVSEEGATGDGLVTTLTLDNNDGLIQGVDAK